MFSTTDVGPIERFRSQLGSIVRKSRSSLSSYDSHETLKGSMSKLIAIAENVLKFFILFSNKMLVIRAGIHKMLLRMANKEDPDQTASSEAV